MINLKGEFTYFVALFQVPKREWKLRSSGSDYEVTECQLRRMELSSH